MSSIYSDWEAKIRSCAGDVINQALDDPLTCDVMVNPDGRIWQERFGEPMKCIGMMESYNLESMIRFLASILHKTVSYEHPVDSVSPGQFRPLCLALPAPYANRPAASSPWRNTSSQES